MVENLINNIDFIESLHSDGISLLSDRVEIRLVKSCDVCDCHNFNIWGTIIKNILKVELRCIKCGKIMSSLESCLYGWEKDELEK